MRALTTILIALALPLIAPAQDAEQTEQQKARARAARTADQTLRWMRSLNMSESQQTQIKKILVENTLKKEQMDQTQGQQIRKLLTPGQQETYDQWVQQLRRSRDRPARNRRSQWGRMGLDPEQLTKTLGLTPEQAKQLKTVMEQAGQSWTRKWQQMQRGGNMDWRTLIRESLTEIRGNIDKLLNTEQKARFAKLVKQTDKQMEAWLGARDDQARARRGSRRAAPQTRIERTVKSAMKLLGCSEEEAAVLGPMIEKLVSYRIKGADRLDRQRKQIAEMAGNGEPDEEALARQVSALATARTAYEKKLALLEDGMRELLSRVQEYGLVGLQVLRPKR